ncbi:MFS transporter [Geodermatophilus sp. SYSU D00697]
MTTALRPHRSATSTLVAVLCGALILFDGYDLIVYGNVVPALLAEPGWGLTPAGAARIASLTLVGMAIGALVAGTIADRVGRRAVIFASLTLFSVSMAACALAPSAESFGAFRVVGGLGLGAMFPLATALIVEFAPVGRRALVYASSFFGYLIGGVVAAGLGLLLLEDAGWRPLFWIGAAPLLVLPVHFRVLPESVAWLVSRGRVDEARAVARRHGLDEPQRAPEVVDGEPVGRTNPLSVLFSRGYGISTVLLWAVQFCSLLLVFGMVTWLPTIMTTLDYSLGFALAFVLVLNLGAAVGAYIAARTADRIGPKPVVVTLFALGALAVALLVVRPPSGVVFLLIALAGAGTLGTQILVNVFAASLYPAAGRATGLGWALGVGRVGGIVGPLIGGAVLGSTLGAEWNFYVFAGVGLLGAIAAVVLPLTPAARAARDARPTSSPEALGATQPAPSA